MVRTAQNTGVSPRQPAGNRRGRIDTALVPELDPFIHERMRLAILTTLALNEDLSFTDLKHRVKITDGNLSVHTRRLEEAGYVTCVKLFEQRIPRTKYRLTTEGRQALQQYFRSMERMIKAVREH